MVIDALQQELMESWNQLQDSVKIENNASVLATVAYLVLGGACAIYLRFLYGRFSGTPSDADTITRVFPLLTVVTTAVIAVVQTSLALSLGLVGALSIVRFRAAIKEPEELVYLFLCIAVGLCLGSAQPWLALALVMTSTLFIVFMHYFGGKGRNPRLMLTISGDSDPYFTDPDQSAVTVIEQVAGDYSVHRLDIEDGRGQVRVLLKKARPDEINRLIASLQKRLPGCEISYVDIGTAV